MSFSGGCQIVGYKRSLYPIQLLHDLCDALSDSEISEIRVIQAGEPLVVNEVLKGFFRSRPNSQLHNSYGPTETTVVTACLLPSNTAGWPLIGPLGRPIWNTEVYVLIAG